MPAKALHSLNRSALMRMTGSDEAGIKRWHHKHMAHVLWQQRCLEVASRLHHVGVVD
jgi:hypothetical protein